MKITTQRNKTDRFTKDAYLTGKLNNQGEQREGNWLSPGPKLVRFLMTTEEEDN